MMELEKTTLGQELFNELRKEREREAYLYYEEKEAEKTDMLKIK